MDKQTRILKAIEESIDVKKRFFEENVSTVIEVAGVITEAFRKGNKLILFGNGGSAADAQHIAAELVNRFYVKDRPPLPAISLTTDTSIITSVSNDVSFDRIFSKQLRAIGRLGDVALAISTSGNSPNITIGIETARELGLTSIALTGGDGGKALKMSDYKLNVSGSRLASRIQETHITIGHVLCELIEEELFGEEER